MNVAVPNSTEDMLELMVFLSNRAEQIGGACIKKIDEIYQKAEIFLTRDNETFAHIKELHDKTHKKIDKRKHTGYTMLCIGAICFIIGIFSFGGDIVSLGIAGVLLGMGLCVGSAYLLTEYRDRLLD